MSEMGCLFSVGVDSERTDKMKLPNSWYGVLLFVTGVVLLYTAFVLRSLSRNLSLLCGALGLVIVVHQVGRFYKRDLLFLSSGPKVTFEEPVSTIPALSQTTSVAPPSSTTSSKSKYPLPEEFVYDDAPEMPPPPLSPVDFKP